VATSAGPSAEPGAAPAAPAAASAGGATATGATAAGASGGGGGGGGGLPWWAILVIVLAATALAAIAAAACTFFALRNRHRRKLPMAVRGTASRLPRPAPARRARIAADVLGPSGSAEAWSALPEVAAASGAGLQVGCLLCQSGACTAPARHARAARCALVGSES
jgi:hypothetical protein